MSTLTLARADPTYPLNIPAQDLGSALKTFGVAVNEQILFSNDVVTGLRSTEVKGEYTTKAAISILLKGSGLQADRTPSGVLLIRRPQDPVSPQATTQAQVDGQGGSNSADKEGRKSSSDGFRVAQVDQGKTARESSVEKQDEQASKKKPVQLEEVVVTGSRIPTVASRAPQEVKIYSREEIEQSGQTNV
ncbi:MAG TPA: STN domain-containing protein, partial [Steroidobacteraceae bacterium]|nr:STN domain-containing protein [Steroidobacteraceae bacterium]